MAEHRELRSYGELLKLVPIDVDGNVLPVPSATEAPAKPRRPVLLFVALVVVPSLIAAALFGFILADRYEAEARVVIRSPSRSVTTQLTNLLKSTGMVRATDDAYAVQEYMRSRDAMDRLLQTAHLRELFGRPEADFIWRFPNPFMSNSNEGLYKAYTRVVDVAYDETSGIVTLRVQAFRPEDAMRFASSLVDAAEQFVNQLNERSKRDAIESALSELERMEKRTVEAQSALTKFRESEMLVDPSQASMIILEGISKLSLELAELNVQITELSQVSAKSPQLQSLRARVVAIEDQILKERRRLAGDDSSLAKKIAQYESLVLEREFAERGVTTALGSLELARTEAQRQQIYLERVANPTAPDYPIYPHRTLLILGVVLAALLVFKVVLAVLADIRRHEPIRTL
jgi:capsular polysaccharide transport system permease protein